jgi:polygalacturonase
VTATTIELLSATTRTATFSIDAAHHLYALDPPLNWEVQRSDGSVALRGNTSCVVFTVTGLEPDNHYVLSAGNVTFGFSTSSESELVDIRDFGASTDAKDNAAAIQSAVATVPDGGTLRVPAGLWLSGPVFLKSRMTLLLEEGATLAALSGRDGHQILPARHGDGRVLGTWEGVAEPCFASLINAIDCEDVTITGLGTIDGGGDRGDWWSWPKETREGARRPRTLFLSGCKDVVLAGVTICNSPSWTVHPVLCRNLLAADLKIYNEPGSPNTDGFNPECCSDVQLIGLHISVGDDCIAIKAGKRHPLGGPDRPAENIQISNCLMARGHGAVVIGSEMSGNVRDVKIAHCHFVGTDRGLRIKTRRGRGGSVSGITLADCRMVDVATPIAVNAFYFCDADGRSDYVQSRSVQPVTAETPRLENIFIRSVSVTGAHTAAAVFYGLPEAVIAGVVIENYTVAFAPDAIAGVAEMACDLPALRHQGIVAENTRFRRLAGLSPASIHPEKSYAEHVF